MFKKPIYVSLLLSPSNRRTTDRLSLMANSHVLLIGSGLRLMKRKRHTLFALGLVGDLQTADLTGLELVDIEQIQQVLDILHAIEVTVDIQVAVFDRIRDSLRLILRRHDLARLLDRARSSSIYLPNASISNKVGRGSPRR